MLKPFFSIALLVLMGCQGFPAFSAEKQKICRETEIRKLPGALDDVPVFNSNSPELVLKEGILLSTFPPEGMKHPEAHLNYALEGRFDLFSHHVARNESSEDERTLYLGFIVCNPENRKVKLQVLSGASYLSQPDAPFVSVPELCLNNEGRVFSGPGDRVAQDLMRNKRASFLARDIVLNPGQTKLMFYLPVPVRHLRPALNGRSTLVRFKSNGPVYVASLARFIGPGQKGALSDSDWLDALSEFDLSSPRDIAPTPLRFSGPIKYGRVAGVARGSKWVAKLSDSDASVEETEQDQSGTTVPVSNASNLSASAGSTETALRGSKLTRLPNFEAVHKSEEAESASSIGSAALDQKSPKADLNLPEENGVVQRLEKKIGLEKKRLNHELTELENQLGLEKHQVDARLERIQKNAGMPGLGTDVVAEKEELERRLEKLQRKILARRRLMQERLLRLQKAVVTEKLKLEKNIERLGQKIGMLATKPSAAGKTGITGPGGQNKDIPEMVTEAPCEAAPAVQAPVSPVPTEAQSKAKSKRKSREQLTIPAPGKSITYLLSTVERGTFGTGQVQSAPMIVRYPDTAYEAHGNYGVSYQLHLPMHNPLMQRVAVQLLFQSAIKSDLPTGEMCFYENAPARAFFRGEIYVSDGKSSNYWHLVQRQGSEGARLLDLSLPAGARKELLLKFIYPPDATPPQELCIKTEALTGD